VRVSLATAAGRSSRYSEPKPLAASFTRLPQPPPGVKVWPPAILKPSLVITSSFGRLVAALVEIVTVLVAAPTARVPVRSRGAAARTPLHSEIWATVSTDAGRTVNRTLGIPPGLFG